MVLVPLESTGHYQRNVASVTFMRCVVFEIRLFLIYVLQKFSELGPMKAEKQLYLENHTTHEDGTCTVTLVMTCGFQ